MRGRAAATAATALLVLAPTALAQDRREPTGRELWRDYPLHQSPDPAADGTAVPSPSGTPAAKASPPAGVPAREEPVEERSDGSPTLLVVGLLTAIAAIAFVRFLRPRARLPDGPRPAARAEHSGTDPRPPDAVMRWMAEVEWEHGGGESRFRVVARRPEGGGGEVTVATSPALEWPPAGPAEVEAMSAAADRLEAALLEAGWTALPSGGAWYAKRFAWEPPSSPSLR